MKLKESLRAFGYREIQDTYFHAQWALINHYDRAVMRLGEWLHGTPDGEAFRILERLSRQTADEYFGVEQ